MNFDLGDVLSRAGQITWRHKVLWVFGMFPILISFLFVPIVFIPMFFIGPNALANQGLVDQPFYVSLFLSTNLFLIVLSILLYAVGSAATSLGILRVENGRTQLPFRDLFQDGLEYFWRILGIALLIGIVVTVVYLLLFGCMMLVGIATLGLGMICLQPLFLLMYPAILLSYTLTEEAQAGVVADQLGIVAAISRGWALIRAHFWKFVLITLIIYLGMIILTSIVTMPFLLPFFFLPLLSENLQAGIDYQNFGWGLLVFSLLLLPFLALVLGISITFIKSAFMIIYLRLTRPTVLQTALQ